MPEPTQFDKARYSLYSAIIFIVLASPPVYRLVNQLIGNLVQITDSTGHATTTGLLVHAIVFWVVVFGIMQIKDI